MKCLCSACGKIELNRGSRTGSQPAGGFGCSQTVNARKLLTGKIVMVLLSVLNKGAEINAFRNPSAENIYTSLKAGCSPIVCFQIQGPTLSAAKSKLSFVYFLKFPSLGFTVHKYVNN